MLSKIFNLAELWELRPDGSNPCCHVKRFKEKRRERFLSDDEYRSLGSALREIEQERSETPAAIAAIRLLMLTGCRLSEIQKLRWEHVDLEAGELKLPETKTGAKVVHQEPFTLLLAVSHHQPTRIAPFRNASLTRRELVTTRRSPQHNPLAQT